MAELWTYYYAESGDPQDPGEVLQHAKDDGKDDYFRITVASQYPTKVLVQVPWIVRILALMPWLNKEYYKFLAWCKDIVDERKEKTVDQPDIFSWLIEEGPLNVGPHKVSMAIESRTAIIAGRSLLFLISHRNLKPDNFQRHHNPLLSPAQNPSLQQRLRRELDSIFKNSHNWEFTILSDIGYNAATHTPLLESCIKEALRINPPFPPG
ncbi:hypothetical protein L873DRAFT_1788484 [Choiromyces venosus 120613-1]|uniref:Uncharacterized protein n=1 Tax=Choiromyces venosus 120613-1 TaxID=1336337 RepID=A0A3N4JS67_9PEZI|nr:hypothetical protein L873DRAFT_1788484 [Choiromyces venosus 120613-1]